jgi:hypothetical protein
MQLNGCALPFVTFHPGHQNAVLLAITALFFDGFPDTHPCFMLFLFPVVALASNGQNPEPQIHQRHGHNPCF